MEKYNFEEIELKWEKIWDEKKSFKAVDFSEKPKYYVLSEFFGPSGKGIHLGHIKCFTPTEVIARYKRLKGFNVLYPAGWDAFGLPTENYAIKTGEQPGTVTSRNIGIFTKQLKRLGYSFDWDRTVATSDTDYFKWTQWIFLQLLKKGMAYKSEGIVNFCPSCMTVLSNEDSQGGICDRCNSIVIQEKRSVWYLRMRDYSEKILAGIEAIDMKENLKESQRNWIGKSEGAKIDFSIVGEDDFLTVFTTRPDTIFGVTFIVIAPEHPIVSKYSNKIKNLDVVLKYKRDTEKKSFIERNANKDKTGVKLEGIKILNPVSKEEICLFISDYVMMNYGTGAIMAVPAHDERDYEFAKCFNIPIIPVVEGGNIEETAYTGDGRLINSRFLNGLDVVSAKKRIVEYLIENNIGEKTISYKVSDWPFNRQRYWGEPFPVVICNDCGYVPLDESELPLILPMTEDFTPDARGNSPLSKIVDWVNVKCPKCGKPAKRETDTMPNWAGSSWYWLRFMDPHNEKEFVSKELLDYWGAVDLYTGGVEHVTRHMLYASFWHNFLYDIDKVPFKVPFIRRMCNGLVLDSEGKKMSKSSGNAIDPIDVVNQYGADAFRLYILFMGDYELNNNWSIEGINGCTRFLESVWNLMDINDDRDVVSDDHVFILNALIKKYSTNIIDGEKSHKSYEEHNDFNFNTVIAEMMKFVNAIRTDGFITKEEFRQFLIVLNPMCPHMTSEIYDRLYCKNIINESFPDYDESKLVERVINIPIQINGKLKGTVEIENGDTEDMVIEKAREVVKSNLDSYKKVIYIVNKIINFIV